jgi:protein-S-isoprenylcysteine O-methyltransferase Ste14
MMGGIASVLYAMIFRRALFGAIYCAIAPLFLKAVRRPNRFGFLLSLWTAMSPRAGRLSFATVATVYILSGIYLDKHDLTAMFGDQYSRYRQQISLLAPSAAAPSVDGKSAMHPANCNLAGHAQTIRRQPLEH